MACIPSCGLDDSDPSMDVAGGFGNDIPAKEINAYTPVEQEKCVGQQRDETFAEYDYQCEWALGKGDCVQMPNPDLGNEFYCALCGMKGSNMVCYMINLE